MIYYLGILVMSIMGSIASFFLKEASGSQSLGGLLKNKFLYIGGLLYCGGMIINIIVLQYLEYSIVLPLTAVTYVWTVFISKIVFKENISVMKYLGIICIVLGAFIVTHV